MRGINREVTKPQNLLYTALGDFRLHGVEYKKGQQFEYDGDPARLVGLAAPGLHPAVTADGKLHLTWLSPINRADGYGGLAEDAVTGLVKQGVDVSLAHIGLVDEYGQTAEIQNLLDAPLKVTGLALLMTPPDSTILGSRLIRQDGTHGMLYPAMKKQFRILYSMFETDQLPRGWAERINQFVEAVFVPSKFLVDVFKKSGVTIPVYHTPIGIDTDFYVPGSRQKKRASVAKDAKREDDETRVLICGNLTRRKNVAAAIAAFQAASKGNAKWKLTIKTQITPEFEEHVWAPVKAANDNRISLVTERYSRAEMLKLYQSHDIFLWPTMGEGIGLPPMEAMSCGLEVVASLSSGALDYISDAVAYPVPTMNVPAKDFKPLHEGDWGEVGNWWTPDEAKLAEQLAAAALATGKVAKGSKARDLIVKEHNSTTTATSILSTIQSQIVPLLEPSK